MTTELVLVLGTGASETGLVAAVVQRLGFAAPRPVISSGEPQWSLRFHDDLLRKAGVTPGDARPSVWTRTAEAGYEIRRRRQLSKWLSAQFERSDRIVVRDPRVMWFIPLWSRAAEDVGVEPAFVTVLSRPVGEATRPAHELGAWLNAMLHIERATRSNRRAFVTFDDLVADWARAVRRLDERVGLGLMRTVRVQQMDAVLDLIDGVDRIDVEAEPTLDVAKPLRELAETAWADLVTLAAGDHDPGPVLARLDAARDEYRRAYSDAEALVWSSIAAARRWGRRAGAQAARSAERGAGVDAGRAVGG